MNGFYKFGVLCVFLILLSAMPVTAMGEDWDGEGTEQNPYLISSLDDMQLLSNNVNDGSTYSGVYFELTADIDMSGTQWTPIGNSSTLKFSGIFNGCGHTIKNMTVNDAGGFAGLFGNVEDGFILCHLNLDGGSVKTSGSYAGGFAAYSASDSTKIYIYDCHNLGCDVITTNTGGAAGGIVGYFIKCALTMEYCSNYADIYPDGTDCCYLGGVAGYMYGSSSKAEVVNCSNYGSIGSKDFSGSKGVGGVIGYCNSCVNIYNCQNRYSSGGAVYATVRYCGGVVGYCMGSSYIGGCYNDGEVISTVRAGGIVGNLTDQVYLCYSANKPGNGTATSGSIAAYMGSAARLNYCFGADSGSLTGNTPSNTSYKSETGKTLKDAAEIINNNINYGGKFKYISKWTGSDDTIFEPYEISEIKLYTDGKVIDTICAKEGETYEALYTPVKQGYTFDGWYTTTDGTYKITQNTVVALSRELSEGKSLYARWTEDGGVRTVPGDVTGDDIADEKDCVYIIRKICGLDTADADFANADVNGDGEADMRDVIQILNK